MRKVTRAAYAVTALALVATSVLPTAANAAPDTQNIPLLNGPPISDIQSRYGRSLACVNNQLTQAQHQVVFTVPSFLDKTNKANFVTDSGTGSFNSQGIDDMLYTSLRLAGVQVTDMSPVQRQLMDWSIQKMAVYNEGVEKNNEDPANPKLQPIKMGVSFPDVGITGAITSTDINVSSGGATVRIVGIGFSHVKNRILIGMDARLSEMIGGARADGKPTNAGAVASVIRIQKQIVGYEVGGGATRFFGSGSKASLVDIDLGTDKREAIQAVERDMADRVAVSLITHYFGITACDATISYEDHVFAPLELTAPASAAVTSASTPVAVPASSAPLALKSTGEASPATQPLNSPAPISTKPGALATQ